MIIDSLSFMLLVTTQKAEEVKVDSFQKFEKKGMVRKKHFMSAMKVLKNEV